MLKSLRIRNLATIEDLELSFEEGFSILTGETGAGKSIIIDGIKLVLGEKSSPEMIRTGKNEASVEAVFEMPRGTDTAGDPLLRDGDEILIQRQIPHDGAGKAYVNGVLVPAKKLKDFAADLVDIYGQNDHIFLLRLENHRDYLDRLLNAADLLEETAGLCREIRKLASQKKELEEKKRDREQRLDFLDFQVGEMEKAGLRPGEWEELSAEREILRNAEKIAGLVDRALELAYLDEYSLLASLTKFRNTLTELGRFDPRIETLNESLGSFGISLREIADDLIKFKDRQADAPDQLDKLEERLDVIEKMKRKYGGSVPDVLAYLGSIRAERARLAAAEDLLSGLEVETGKKLQSYRACAVKLFRMRTEAARRLEKRIEEEIGLLGMKRARFEIRVEAADPALITAESARESGMDEVEFVISPNPGEELKPLRKIASGGELSRIMLALKAVGKEKGTGRTLIFDEIDSGIGGKTAEFIAQKLKALAGHHQIICITHLPQIASFAANHFRIDKKMEKDRTYTLVKKLKFDERIVEISRLLSGSRITETSLQNAREMLEHNLGVKEKKP
jgi:DNA repair protein RecN (Recombination protein N)